MKRANRTHSAEQGAHSTQPRTQHPAAHAAPSKAYTAPSRARCAEPRTAHRITNKTKNGHRLAGARDNDAACARKHTSTTTHMTRLSIAGRQKLRSDSKPTQEKNDGRTRARSNRHDTTAQLLFLCSATTTTLASFARRNPQQTKQLHLRDNNPVACDKTNNITQPFAWFCGETTTALNPATVCFHFSDSCKTP